MCLTLLTLFYNHEVYYGQFITLVPEIQEMAWNNSFSQFLLGTLFFLIFLCLSSLHTFLRIGPQHSEDKNVEAIANRTGKLRYGLQSKKDKDALGVHTQQNVGGIYMLYTSIYKYVYMYTDQTCLQGLICVCMYFYTYLSAVITSATLITVF